MKFSTQAIATALACTGTLLSTLVALAPAAQADTAQARCDYYPRGQDRASASQPCTFSQRQGFITLRRQDGLTHEFRPDPNRAALYTDSQGGRVDRIDSGSPTYTIYQTRRESIYVYWGEGHSPGHSGSSGPSRPR